MVVVEKYPELKANQGFLDLQAQLEGTENRITVERQKFNQTAQTYNTFIRTFPKNIFAGMFGFEKKAATFFDADAITELQHAELLQKYMTDFNIVPQIPSAKPEHTFSNLIDIIYQAYEFELRLMKSYNKDSSSVFSEDLTTFDFLETFRDIQRESVVEFNDLINASNLINKNNKFDVLYFEQTYF
jgi:ferritin